MKNTIAEAIHEILKTEDPFFSQLYGRPIGNEIGFQNRLYLELCKNSVLYEREYVFDSSIKGKSGRIDIAKFHKLPYKKKDDTGNISACIEIGHYSLNQQTRGPRIDKYIEDVCKRIRFENIYIVGIVTNIKNMRNAKFPNNFNFTNSYVGKTKKEAKENCDKAQNSYSQINDLINEFSACFDPKPTIIPKTKNVNGVEIELNFIIAKVIINNTIDKLKEYIYKNNESVDKNKITFNKKNICNKYFNDK